MNKRRYILTQWEEVIPGEYEIVTYWFVDLAAKRRPRNE